MPGESLLNSKPGISHRRCARLFPVHHVPCQCSYQDLCGFGVKEKSMLRDQQFESQNIWKNKGTTGRLFVLKSWDAADLIELHWKINPRKRSGGWGRIYKIVMWLVHAYGWILLRTLFLGSKRSPDSTFLSSFQTCRLVPLKYLFNVCYVYILKGDMNFSGHF